MEITLAHAALFSLFESAVAVLFLPRFSWANTATSICAVCFFCNVSILVFYKLVVYPFVLSPLRDLPQGVGFLPVVGHELGLFKRPGGEPHLKMMKEVENDGLILTRGIFHKDKLIVSTPAALADVLVHKSYDMEKPPWARAFLRKFLGDGLLMSEGDEYMPQLQLRILSVD
jgi:hypothetical protein